MMTTVAILEQRAPDREPPAEHHGDSSEKKSIVFSANLIGWQTQLDEINDHQNQDWEAKYQQVYQLATEILARTQQFFMDSAPKGSQDTSLDPALSAVRELATIFNHKTDNEKPRKGLANMFNSSNPEELGLDPSVTRLIEANQRVRRNRSMSTKGAGAISKPLATERKFSRVTGYPPELAKANEETTTNRPEPAHSGLLSVSVSSSSVISPRKKAFEEGDEEERTKGKRGSTLLNLMSCNPDKFMMSLHGSMFHDSCAKAFTIEEQISAKDCQFVELTEIADTYTERFGGAKHYNWIAVDEAHPRDPLIISILSRKQPPGVTNCLMNTKKGFQHVTIPFENDTSKGATCERELRAMFPKLSLFRVADDISVIKEISDIEKKHRQETTKFSISIVYCKKDQTDPLKMFKNKDHSKEFDNFLKAMNVPPGPVETVAWRDKEVTYYLATKMNSEQHRRLIGNTQAVIFFKDNDGSKFSTEFIETMGAVPQFFLVVQSLESKFRVGCFYRVNLKTFHPYIPSDLLFDSISIRDFALAKVHNGYMMTRSVPPINRLWEAPRQEEINEFARHHASKAWLKKHSIDSEPRLN